MNTDRATVVSDHLRGDLARACMRLLADCRQNEWSGHDPYDALNSPLFQRPPLGSSRRLRIVATQILKRSPINLRPILRIEKSCNPKALALFLSASVVLWRQNLMPATNEIRGLTDLLLNSSSDGKGWGYAFPWQTRTELVPKGQANLVCTVFVANALLDAYDALGDERCIAMAERASRYILDELYWKDDSGRASLAYPLATSRVPVHNANLLGAALLCRVHRHTGCKTTLQRALCLARHAVSRQAADGAWTYGDAPHWAWIDNFHTGFNLCALRTIAAASDSAEFDGAITNGLAFYRREFLLDSGATRYHADRTYPIDIHCVAQAIITLVELRQFAPGCLDAAASVFRWARENMLGPDGRFYYQVWPWFTNKISYMRWSQAWMLLAMATFSSALSEEQAQVSPLFAAA
jgi:hypothetical protein